ncbi:hypothetical protein NDU88_009201 [Pleurodeles waltl]|uniref:Uncharacterized protein n=1 Tax=Pleurodeles waltl TaxID=8319 RepID=A0AAV7RXU9_PLEWA|nr:hypothetical protein NDU88_009201 [Pleurodeles waltl]
MPGRRCDRSAGSVICSRIRERTGTSAQFAMDAEASRDDSRPLKEDRPRVASEASAPSGRNWAERGTAEPRGPSVRRISFLLLSRRIGVRPPVAAPQRGGHRRQRLTAPGTARNYDGPGHAAAPSSQEENADERLPPALSPGPGLPYHNRRRSRRGSADQRRASGDGSLPQAASAPATVVTVGPVTHWLICGVEGSSGIWYTAAASDKGPGWLCGRRLPQQKR